MQKRERKGRVGFREPQSFRDEPVCLEKTDRSRGRSRRDKARVCTCGVEWDWLDCQLLKDRDVSGVVTAQGLHVEGAHTT